MIEKRKVLIGATGIALVLVFALSGFVATSSATSYSTSQIYFHVLNYDHWQVKVCNSSNKCSSKYTNSKGNTGYFAEPGGTTGTATLYHSGYKCSEVGVYFAPGKVEFVWESSTISSAKQCK